LRNSWARYALKRYTLLRKWRELAKVVAKACKEVLGRECINVYVVGGAAEDRLTVLSDIDIAIIVGDPELKNIETIVTIKRKSEELGIPTEAPIDIKILTKDEFKELTEKGIYRKAVKIL